MHDRHTRPLGFRAALHVDAVTHHDRLPLAGRAPQPLAHDDRDFLPGEVHDDHAAFVPEDYAGFRHAECSRKQPMMAPRADT